MLILISKYRAARAAWVNDTPLPLARFTASSLNSRLNFLLCIENLQSHQNTLTQCPWNRQQAIHFPYSLNICVTKHYPENSMNTKKRILVLGATGRTGQHFITLALKKGHAVRALVRTPSKLFIQNPDLEICVGSVTSYEKLD